MRMGDGIDRWMAAATRSPPCIGPVLVVLLRYCEYVTEIRSESALRYQGTSFVGSAAGPGPRDFSWV